MADAPKSPLIRFMRFGWRIPAEEQLGFEFQINIFAYASLNLNERIIRERPWRDWPVDDVVSAEFWIKNTSVEEAVDSEIKWGCVCT